MDGDLRFDMADYEEKPLAAADKQLKVLKKQSLLLWMYIANEGLWEDAHEFVLKGYNSDEPFYYGE